MKIILACGIFPPDIGGPATYADKLAGELKNLGHEVVVLAYRDKTNEKCKMKPFDSAQGGNEKPQSKIKNDDFPVFTVARRWPKGIRHLIYFCKLLILAARADVIYAQNILSVGLAALLAARILKKKVAIRLGGDFLWERACEQKGIKIGLVDYYDLPKTIKERFLTAFLKKILNAADKIIFSTYFQKEIYQKHFAVKDEKSAVIANPFPEISVVPEKALPVKDWQLLFAGRLIKLKNLDFLLDVFAKVLSKTDFPLRLKIIGDGPEKENLMEKARKMGLGNAIIFEGGMPHQKLLAEIQASFLCLLPSLSEVSPNFALECLKMKKPILLTRETGIFENFKESLIFLDPADGQTWQEQILRLLEQDKYQEYLRKISSADVSRNWRDAVKEHILLFQTLF